jgi:membrane-bound inhibitor of C-type lysozyme
MTIAANPEARAVGFGARYTDGIYVFWSKGDSATVYKRDRIVLNNCQLQNPRR